MLFEGLWLKETQGPVISTKIASIALLVWCTIWKEQEMAAQIVEWGDKVPRNPHYIGSINDFSDFLALGHKKNGSKNCGKNVY